MSLLKRLCREENGQGLTEYTLVIVLVALVFWIGVRDTQVGQKFGPRLGEGSRLHYVTVFLHRLMGRSRA